MASQILETFYLRTLQPPSWPPRSPQQGPQTAPQAPSWRGRGPHEATKSQLDTYFDVFSCDFVVKSKKKSKRRHSSLSKRFPALELFLHLLHPLLLLLRLLLLLLLLCPLRLPHYHDRTKTKTKTRTKTKNKINIKTETQINLRLRL